MQSLPLNEIIVETIKRILSVIQPTKVILFGSAARGEMHENSDIDLLIVTPAGTHRRKTAQKIYRNMIGVGFAADIVVITEDDLERYKEHHGMIIHQALEDGRVIYAA